MQLEAAGYRKTIVRIRQFQRDYFFFFFGFIFFSDAIFYFCRSPASGGGGAGVVARGSAGPPRPPTRTLRVAEEWPPVLHSQPIRGKHRSIDRSKNTGLRRVTIHGIGLRTRRDALGCGTSRYTSRKRERERSSGGRASRMELRGWRWHRTE